MCLAGREHSPTVKQKEEKQQQKQPLPMACATECSKLPFPLCGLATHGSSTPTGGGKERCPAREDNDGRDLRRLECSASAGRACVRECNRGSLGCKANARRASSAPCVEFKVFDGGLLSTTRRDRKRVATLLPTCCPMAKHLHQRDSNNGWWYQLCLVEIDLRRRCRRNSLPTE